MSSTSSSDYENGDYCRCGHSLDDRTYNINCSCSYYGRHTGSSRHVPFSTAMGHPLIYYAEVQRPLNRRQRNDPPRKENQNCFVKAFKWYTQERVPDKKYDVAPERNGFANWLDSKYIEYLRESRPNQVYQLTVQETTTIDPCVPCTSSPCEPSTTKRFARMRSPWRKRRRPCKDSGDVVEKCPNQSCEFILQPKDLTRAASDCCYPGATSGCFKSNATVASSNTPGMTRCSARSHSLSSVCRERSVPKQIDTIPCTVQEGSKTQQPTKPTICRREQIQQMPSKSRTADVCCQCPEEYAIPVDAETQYEPMGCMMSYVESHAPCYCIIDDGQSPKPVKIRSRKLSTPEIKPTRVPSTQSYTPKKHKKAKKRPSVSCQCPEESIVKVDTQSQYQADPAHVCECRNVCAPCCPPRMDLKEMNQVFGPKTLRQSLSTVVVNETADACECTVKEVATMSKCTCSLPCFANDAVQTSDHSICLDRAGVPYPLFMKIVCADRLD